MVKKLVLVLALCLICFPCFADSGFAHYVFYPSKVTGTTDIVFDSITGEYCYNNPDNQWVCRNPFVYPYYFKIYNPTNFKDPAQPTWFLDNAPKKKES